MKHEYKDAITIYKQIALSIENSILEGELNDGDKVSSLRESAVEMEVNINTIMKAYNILEEEGILIKKRGLGFFINDCALEIISNKRKKEFYQITIPALKKTLNQLEISHDELLIALKK